MENKYKAIKVNGKKVDEHRNKMEILLGRKLTFNEVVHHVDGNKSNNEISNLMLMTRSEHSKIHSTGLKKNPSTIEKIRVLGILNRPASKISIETVKQIRKCISEGFKNIEISKKLNVSKHTVGRIRRNQNWSWVKD